MFITRIHKCVHMSCARTGSAADAGGQFTEAQGQSEASYEVLASNDTLNIIVEEQCESVNLGTIIEWEGQKSENKKSTQRNCTQRNFHQNGIPKMIKK
eukprot:2103791-Amphidinium_carterae.1